ncbi:hypothetical protein PIB30_003527 [Stylosanthes scabra]|uniref:Uncharacterized protein n=1 Tax=Stylosanthes scabra TaxID=79078 RepID=A0ABU6W446_9FABA|nr:hypothetical protein [Stylosanthes scabra]
MVQEVQMYEEGTLGTKDAASADQVSHIAATVEVAIIAAANDPIAEIPKDDSQPTTKIIRSLSYDAWHYFDKIGVGNDGKERAQCKA